MLLREAIAGYNTNEGPVYGKFLDAKKAFYRVNYY
jgi:hypothetical protein